MTPSTTAPTQSSATTQHEIVDTGSVPVPGVLTERGYSDSVLPACRMSADKQQGTLCHASPTLTSPPLPSNPPIQGTDVTSIPNRMKAGQDLRLPSFESLGIAALTPHPAALLTPPEDTTLPDVSPPSTTTAPQQRSQSLPRTIMPKTPELADPDKTPIQTDEGNTPRQGVTTIICPEISGPNFVTTSGSGALGAVAPMNMASWSLGAIEVVVNTATQNTTRNLVSLLCHSQPCPLPSEGTPTTAFGDLMTALQTRISTDAYIEVTHAVPLKFTMGQVPTSPAVTPNPLAHQPVDYFSIQNTFSKAVVATSYQDALETSVPSSPHPVVAPSTVHVSLLERYIPPASSNEYQDLFSTNAPSALVNRLTELSSDRGSLLFVYPTKAGSIKFQADYLGPLLDPLVRTMSGVHGLRSDLGTNIATMTAIDHMHNFDVLQRKVRQLLVKLGRGNTNTNRPPPKFEITYNATQKVPLDRTSWQTWYIHQEKHRIQEIVKRYFQRGLRLPITEGVTSGALCREILQGLEQREYAANCPTRDGVEVGVFVIQRTA